MGIPMDCVCMVSNELLVRGRMLIRQPCFGPNLSFFNLAAMVWSHGGVAGLEPQPHLAVKVCNWSLYGGDQITLLISLGHQYWRQAAEMGHLASMYELGVALYMGDGTVEDPEQAVKYFRQAAHLGHSGAAYLMVDCYLDGVGVTRDRSKAFEWLMTAAEMGHRQAQRRGETLLTSNFHPEIVVHSPNPSTTRLEDVESARWERTAPSDWYRKVSLERRFSIGGGSRNPTILFRRKTNVADSRRSEE